MHIFFIYVFIGKYTRRKISLLAQDIPRTLFEVHEHVVIHVLRHLLLATETDHARWPLGTGTTQRGCSVLLSPLGLLSQA